MTSIKSPHVGSFRDGGPKTPSWWSIPPLYSLSKRGEDLCLFPNFSNCCCLRITTSCSPVIASYWPLRVCKIINHISHMFKTLRHLSIQVVCVPDCVHDPNRHTHMFNRFRFKWFCGQVRFRLSFDFRTVWGSTLSNRAEPSPIARLRMSAQLNWASSLIFHIISFFLAMEFFLPLLLLHTSLASISSDLRGRRKPHHRHYLHETETNPCWNRSRA